MSEPRFDVTNEITEAAYYTEQDLEAIKWPQWYCVPCGEPKDMSVLCENGLPAPCACGSIEMTTQSPN